MDPQGFTEIASGLGISGVSAVLLYVVVMYKKDTARLIENIKEVMDLYREDSRSFQKTYEHTASMLARQQELSQELKDIITLNTQEWMKVRTILETQECPLLKNACIESVSLAGESARRIGKAMNS